MFLLLVTTFTALMLATNRRLKAAEKRLQVFQGELNNCKERLRATSELLQIANDGHALPLQHLALLEQKMREGERRAEVAQLHEEVRCRRTYREMNIRQNRMLASVRDCVKTMVPPFMTCER